MSPMRLIVVKFDTISTSGGIIIVAIVRANRIFFPLNSKNEKAKAAMVAVTILVTLQTEATIKELSMYRSSMVLENAVL